MRTIISVSANRVRVQALVGGRSLDYEHLARLLLHALDLTHHFDLEVIADPAQLQ